MNKTENDYAKLIVSFLEKAKEPQDIEKIRVACKVGNWNTALKHCLELLLAGTICGQKTSKSWIFWVNKEVPVA